jgi:hypothetical protein
MDPDLEELEGEELMESLRKEGEMLGQRSVSIVLMQQASKMGRKDWSKATAKHSMGYTGRSERRQREIRQQLRQKEERDAKTRNT